MSRIGPGRVSADQSSESAAALPAAELALLPSYTLASLPPAGTAGRLADVTDSIGGIHKDIGPRWVQQFGDIINVRERPFGAVGNDVTNDTTAIQNALNAVPSAGGTVYLPPGYTYLVNSANLTFKANTTLWIPVGAILHLDTTRLTAVDVSNIVIIGGGKIRSTNLNTTDALLTNWFARGIVEFGSTTATPVSNIRVEGIEVDGDWVGTPGAIVIGANDRRRGLLFINTKYVHVSRNTLHNIIGEVIINNQGAGGAADNVGHIYEGNVIYAFNFDGYSTNQTVIADAVFRKNLLYNGYNAIEAFMGTISQNMIDTMVNAGITTGGNNNNGNPVSYVDNDVRNVTAGSGIDLSFNASVLSGPVKVIGNKVHSVAGTGLLLSNIKDLLAVDNQISQAGTVTAASSSMSVSNTTRGYVAHNSLTNPATNATRGMNYGNNTNLVFGPNHVEPHTDTHFNIEGATGIDPQPRMVIGAGLNEAVTGTTAETTINTRTIRGNLLRSDGGFHVVAAGIIAGVAGTKTIRLKFGTSTIATVTLAAGETDDWRIEAWIQNVANANSQKFSVLAHQGAAIEVQDTGGTSEVVTGNLELAITGQLGNAGDTITQNVWVIDPVVGIRRTN